MKTSSRSLLARLLLQINVGITILIIAHFRSREKGFDCGDLIFEFA